MTRNFSVQRYKKNMKNPPSLRFYFFGSMRFKAFYGAKHKVCLPMRKEKRTFVE